MLNFTEPTLNQSLSRFLVRKLPKNVYSSTPKINKEHRAYLTPVQKALEKASHIAWNNKLHITFKLTDPVYKFSFKQRFYAEDILKRLTIFFGGDKAFANFLTKNPFYKKFLAITITYFKLLNIKITESKN